MSGPRNLKLPLKPILGRAVKYVKLTVLVSIVASVGILMGEKSFIQKRELEQKKLQLQRNNELVTVEIKSLERGVTLLRADPKTIEKVAKQKLGMARPDETVYIFQRSRVASTGATHAGAGLRNRHNMP